MDRISKEVEIDRNTDTLVLAHENDIAVVPESWEDLQHVMEKWNEVLNR